ncbi:MAG: MBL fold metallo-hydrolase [Erysipelotrichaceae bacterium]|nr:MBL fold metallo-hydrolase [Erysipelotrichaceae bacterium]
MKCTMLGTGHAMVTELYNTCFVLEENGEYFLTDGGGGNRLLKQLSEVHINLTDIRTVFVTHKHTDHIMGIVWYLRVMCQSMSRGKVTGEATVYAHEEVIGILRSMITMVLDAKDLVCLDKTLHLVAIEDGETKTILTHPVTFFDIHSTKAKQFGFTMEYEGKKLTCLGDEPYNPLNEEYVRNSEWLFCEAFCLYGERDVYHLYEIHHSTVKDACELAETLSVHNVVLYHTEEKHKNRKELYTKEGQQYFHGNIIVPEDLETMAL